MVSQVTTPVTSQVVGEFKSEEVSSKHGLRDKDFQLFNENGGKRQQTNFRRLC